MKIFKNCDCDVSIQNYGSVLRVILRGNETNITETFNGLFNYGATNSVNLRFTNPITNATAWFWSSPKQMRKFFEMLYFFRYSDADFAKLRTNRGLNRRPNASKANALEYNRQLQSWVSSQLKELGLTNEKFLTLEKRDYNPMFEVSSASAERPDDDFRDAVLKDAFSNKTVDTAIGND